ncbi:contact-dependent growth inhibition system immunity protein [Sphingomonas asaccharolytica]|uniref:contact-dependent growth inhibition system immunity protein n=1 Tax=Sphingomonas asaccharolytica TaxID=40681 RepID=UPI00082EF203|nr:contact-dependent growth inhibition system immunity protein [Sphingomonas asaccharolytica]
MSRATLERRRIAEERWPNLANLLGSYFSQDFESIDGSLTEAIDAAALDGTPEHRRVILEEWRDWNLSEGIVDDIRSLLGDGFGVEVHFETPREARIFMNRIYDSLKSSVSTRTT